MDGEKHVGQRWDASVFLDAAAAKSLLLCLTLCDPIDSSPPGSPIPGILQARILKWVAISFSNAWLWKVKVKLLSHVQLLATPWTAAHQTSLSMGFSRQEYWSGVPLPSPFLDEFSLNQLIVSRSPRHGNELSQDYSNCLTNHIWQQTCVPQEFDIFATEMSVMVCYMTLLLKKTKIIASGPNTSLQIDGEKWKQWQTSFSWAPKMPWMVTVAMKLKDTCSLEEKLWQT